MGTYIFHRSLSLFNLQSQKHMGLEYCLFQSRPEEAYSVHAGMNPEPGVGFCSVGMLLAQGPVLQDIFSVQTSLRCLYSVNLHASRDVCAFRFPSLSSRAIGRTHENTAGTLSTLEDGK